MSSGAVSVSVIVSSAVSSHININLTLNLILNLIENGGSQMAFLIIRKVKIIPVKNNAQRYDIIRERGVRLMLIEQ